MGSRHTDEVDGKNQLVHKVAEPARRIRPFREQSWPIGTGLAKFFSKADCQYWFAFGAHRPSVPRGWSGSSGSPAPRSVAA